MREKWARLIVLFTGLIVLLLAMVFSFVQNPNKTSTELKNEQQVSSTMDNNMDQKSVRLDSKLIEEGRKIYQEKNCPACHSIAGKGNPRAPLDSVGTRRTAEEIRNWITGSDNLQDLLPDRIRKLKQRYKELSDDELDVLISYLRNN